MQLEHAGKIQSASLILATEPEPEPESEIFPGIQSPLATEPGNVSMEA